MSTDDAILIAESILGESCFNKLLKIILKESIKCTGAKRAYIFLHKNNDLKSEMLAEINDDGVLIFSNSNDRMYDSINLVVSEAMIFNEKHIGVIYIYEKILSENESKDLKYIATISAAAIQNMYMNKNYTEHILQQKKVEEELRESEERYRRLFELSPSGILVHKNGTTIFTNQKTADMVGAKSPNELSGRSMLEFIHPDYHDIVMERIDYINKGGVNTSFLELKVVNFNGDIIDVEGATTTFPYNGSNTILVVFTDITERKTMEYDRMKTEFIANISHELRTPINVILATLQLFELKLNKLKNYNEKEKYIGYIFTMKQNCYRLTRLINNLIDVTKIDAGYVFVDFNNHNIVNIVEDITLSVAEYVENKGLQLVFDTNVEEKIMACDSEKIERIMLNLISNAVKFTKSGGTIIVTICDMGEKIVISVKDTGVGIPKDKQENIFERFVQVDKSLAREHEGSGIGLCLVKSLVELHKGNIFVKSEEGKGSEFIIEFPVRLVNDNENIDDKDIGSKHNNTEKVNIEFSDIYL